jgi:hypothetical protein
VERASGDAKYRKIVYVPLPSQRRFHRFSARFKGFSGPIGSGKSQALCQEAIRLTYLNPGTARAGRGAHLFSAFVERPPPQRSTGINNFRADVRGTVCMRP